MPARDDGQQAKILAAFLQLGEELTTLFKRQPDKLFRDTCWGVRGHAQTSSSSFIKASISSQSAALWLCWPANSAAKSASSGRSNKLRSGRLKPSSRLMRATTWAANREGPPRA